MIFSHGPVGALLGSLLVLRNKAPFSLYHKRMIILFGFVAGILPDSDLIYYYFFSAKNSHHEFISHTLFPYLIITVILFLIGWFKKNVLMRTIAYVFGCATFSHLLLDMVTSGIRPFFPLSELYVTLLRFPGMQTGSIGSHLFLFHFSLELILLVLGCVITLPIIAPSLFQKRVHRSALIIVSCCIVLAGIPLLAYLEPHVFFGEHTLSYDDPDHDQSITRHDRDMDGDGIPNSADSDANGNGITNDTELKKYIVRMQGVWYDHTRGPLHEILLRLGFFTNELFIDRLYSGIGIPLREEITVAARDHLFTYQGSPEDASFAYQSENLEAYMTAVLRTVSYHEPLRIGDVLFFENDHHIGIVASGDEMPTVLHADTEKGMVIDDLQVMIEKFGNPRSMSRFDY